MSTSEVPAWQSVARLFDWIDIRSVAICDGGADHRIDSAHGSRTTVPGLLRWTFLVGWGGS
ncbi:MAG: hypothetical protein JWL86_3543 [Rhizobium sp.]|nr:hypothetical protein [Rhizobium sp.]